MLIKYFLINIKKVKNMYKKKSLKKNIDIDYMDDVFMTPNDEYDNEKGKWDIDVVPEKKSYSELMSIYDDFCFNHYEGYDTSDEFWTFIYDDGNIIYQEGERISYGEKKQKRKDFVPIKRRNLIGIIYSTADSEEYWYKNSPFAKDIFIEYTGWSFVQDGDDWI